MMREQAPTNMPVKSALELLQMPMRGKWERHTRLCLEDSQSRQSVNRSADRRSLEFPDNVVLYSYKSLVMMHKLLLTAGFDETHSTTGCSLSSWGAAIGHNVSRNNSADASGILHGDLECSCSRYRCVHACCFMPVFQLQAQ